MIVPKQSFYFSERTHDYDIRRTDKENRHIPGLDAA